MAENQSNRSRVTPATRRAEPARSRPPPGAPLLRPKQRRAQRAAEDGAAPKEINGRGGLEPVRYGDWEVKGIASDF